MASACNDMICLLCERCSRDNERQTPEGGPGSERELLAEEEGRRYKQIADATLVYILGRLPRNDGTFDKQLDVYSGVNGYHIRTIPGGRWSNPVRIGAGAGLLAIVDRYDQYDVIRITDCYGGAGEEGFDDDGFPLDSVAWEELDDICQAQTPQGMWCSGLSLSSRGAVIVNLSSSQDGKTDSGTPGNGSYMLIDAVGTSQGSPVGAYGGQRSLKTPLHTLGALVGSPAFRSAELGEESFQSLSVLSGAYSIATLFNYLDGKIIALMGLPADYDVLGSAITNDVVSVLLGSEGYGSLVLRFFMTDESGLMAGKRIGKMNSDTTGYDVTLAPAFRDLASVIPVASADDLHAYLRVAARINQKTHAQETRGDDLVAALGDLLNQAYGNRAPAYDEAGDLRGYASESSDKLNDYRVQTRTSLQVASYNREIPFQSISIPSELKLKTIVSTPGNIIELFNQTGDDGLPDTAKPLFRIVHGSYYDWVLDGGFTYGCIDPATGEVAPNTNGVIGDAIAVDKSLRLGKLKQRDLRVALVDEQTGYRVYRSKPLKGNQSDDAFYKVYAGAYASLRPYDPTSNLTDITSLTEDNERIRSEMGRIEADSTLNQEQKEAQLADLQDSLETNNEELDTLGDGVSNPVAKRTPCSDTFDTFAGEIDGISRPSHEPIRPETEDEETPEPVAAWYNANDCDRPWAIFTRRVQASKKIIVTPDIKRWTMRETPTPDMISQPALLPEYRDAMASPMEVTQDASLFYPPVTRDQDEPTFVCTAGGGFWIPNWAMQATTTHAKWREQIADYNDAIEQIDNALTIENAKPTPDQAVLDALNASKERLTGKIEALEARINESDPENLVEVPSSILKHKFEDLELSPAQEIDREGATYDEESLTAPQDRPRWGVVAIGDNEQAAERRRGCVFHTDIRTWLGFEYKLERYGQFVDGKASYSNPDMRLNGLGKLAGSFGGNDQSGYGAAFGIAGGNIYESGYRSYYDTGGAEGYWKIEVWVDGTPLEELLEDGQIFRATYWDIYWRAPSELQQTLYNVMYANGGVTPGRGAHGGRVWFTPAHVETVRVRVSLLNYAFDVYRNGYHTFIFNDSRGESAICPRHDPGYAAGDNCEASGCGNITCPSRSFGHKNKLQNTDPHYAVTGQVVWQGDAVYSLKEDPYADLGILMGRYFDCYFSFDLKSPISGYDINIGEDPMGADE